MSHQGRTATDASWDETITAFNTQHTPSTAASSPMSSRAARDHQTADARRIEGGAYASQTNIDASWAAAVASVNAANGLKPLPL